MQNTRQIIVDTIRETCPTTVSEITDLDKSLMDYGLDSLDISGVLLALEERFTIKIPDEDMDELTTVNQITAYIQNADKG